MKAGACVGLRPPARVPYDALLFSEKGDGSCFSHDVARREFSASIVAYGVLPSSNFCMVSRLLVVLTVTLVLLIVILGLDPPHTVILGLSPSSSSALSRGSTLGVM